MSRTNWPYREAVVISLLIGVLNLLHRTVHSVDRGIHWSLRLLEESKKLARASKVRSEG